MIKLFRDLSDEDKRKFLSTEFSIIEKLDMIYFRVIRDVFRGVKMAVSYKKLFHLLIEKDMTKKHMFPLNRSFPRYRESQIVCVADKICSLAEIADGLWRL